MIGVVIIVRPIRVAPAAKVVGVRIWRLKNATFAIGSTMHRGRVESTINWYTNWVKFGTNSNAVVRTGCDDAFVIGQCCGVSTDSPKRQRKRLFPGCGIG
jgi:hypothetical protein